MKVDIILEHVDDILLEMARQELLIVTKGLEKEFKKFGLRLELSRHFVDYALKSTDPRRQNIEAPDLYRTVTEFLNKKRSSIEGHKKHKKEYEVAVTNTRTGLTVLLSLKFHLEPQPTSTPYIATIITGIHKGEEKFNMDNRPLARVEVHV